MSQEELKNYFSIEREKHFKFFLPYYQEKNWIVHKDNINGNCAISWDVQLEIEAGKLVLVDEKVREKDKGDFLVEIIQDMKTGKIGWLFGEKDYILYGSWEDLKEDYPKSLYAIDSDGVKNYINSLKGFITTCISKKGWGNTWNIVLDWNNLIIKGIAKKLI
jgi:hypothetical protein